MNDLRKAAQQALEALEYYQHRRLEWDYSDEVAITALRAALAEPVQEPVAWMDIDRDGVRLSVRMWTDGNRDEVPLYTAPPQRKPLTDEEIRHIKPVCADLVDFRSGVRRAEWAHGIE